MEACATGCLSSGMRLGVATGKVRYMEVSKKKRLPIPRAVRDSVLREFSHRCAICGADRPQIHHIDEDPSNNDPVNLLPICPNCHLTDQHNPTAPADPQKLALFRRYKDPTILSPQFEPLFSRASYLVHINDSISFDISMRDRVNCARSCTILRWGNSITGRLLI